VITKSLLPIPQVDIDVFHELDRDLNAALNLKKLYTASSAGIHALGDGSSDCSVTNDFSPSLKKESNGKFTYTLKRGVDFCKF